MTEEEQMYAKCGFRIEDYVYIKPDFNHDQFNYYSNSLKLRALKVLKDCENIPFVVRNIIYTPPGAIDKFGGEEFLMLIEICDDLGKVPIYFPCSWFWRQRPDGFYRKVRTVPTRSRSL